tara:strand:+ start:1078 stop:1422 length:345 start_codon:yes stop_codon:yes gene_type:complete
MVFLDGEKLITFNRWICHILYLPIAVIVTLTFCILNFLLVPVAYAKHLIVLIGTVTDADETMDELSEKLTRIVTILKFALVGLPFLIFASVIDVGTFMVNLYSKPNDADEKIDM